MISERLEFLVASEILNDKLKSKGLRSFIFSHQSFLGRVREIQKIIPKHMYDTIIFNGGNSIFMSLFIRHTNKIIYKHTTYEAYGNIIRQLGARLMTECNILFSKKIVHVSEYSLNQQILQRKKGIVIYHGINWRINEKKNFQKPLKLLFIGRLETAKGIHLIIEAVKKFNSNDVVLTIAGDGILKDYVISNQTNNISYVGYVDDVRSLYKDSDVFVTLPKFEAFGLTILEAMTNGLPVLCTATGGTTEIIEDGKNGIIVDRSMNSLVTAILDIINSYSLKEMSINANITARRFSLTNTLNRVNDIL